MNALVMNISEYKNVILLVNTDREVCDGDLVQLEVVCVALGEGNGAVEDGAEELGTVEVALLGEHDQRARGLALRRPLRKGFHRYLQFVGRD